MSEPGQVAQDEYTVVVNDEEQYSIWAVGRSLPLGWRETGMRGSKERCLAHIAEVWTDMRPLSARQPAPGRPMAG